MLKELIVSTIASLIAGGITGFLGQKTIKNFNSIILKAYVLFLSVIIFITSELFAFVICNTMIKQTVSAHDIERLYRFFSSSVLLIVLFLVMVTTGVIIAEFYHRNNLMKLDDDDLE